MGPRAAGLFVEIFTSAINQTGSIQVKTDAIDNLLLFIQKVIKESGAGIAAFKPVIDDSFNQIRSYQGEDFLLFIRSFYQIKKLAEAFLNCSSGVVTDYQALNLLLIEYFKHTYSHWLSEEDPQNWFVKEAGNIDNPKVINRFFKNISHQQTHHFMSELEDIARSENIASEDVLKRLLVLPGYSQFVETYREIPQILLSENADDGRGQHFKLIFLFHIMNISGLAMIHEEALREINRTMSWIIGHEDYKNVQKLIQKTFSILKARTGEFPATALNCVLNMGKAVYKTDDSDLVNFFIDSVIDLGFQAPMIGGVGNDWQIKSQLRPYPEYTGMA